jgi:hypothetical protein
MGWTRKFAFWARFCAVIVWLMICSSAPAFAACNLNGAWAGSFSDDSGDFGPVSVTFFNSTATSYNASVTVVFENLGGEPFSGSISGPINGSTFTFQYVLAGVGTQSGVGNVSADCNSISGNLTSRDLSGNSTTGPFTITRLGIALSLGQVTFQSVPIGGSSTPQALTLTNSSSSPIALGAPMVTAQFAATTNCGSNLSPAANCSISVTCKPSGPGIQTGNLYINNPSNAPISSTALTCSGVSQLPGATFVPQSGWWWDSKLNGTGFFVEYGGNSGKGLFVGGFLYDGAGKSTWLVSTGPITGPTYTSNWLKVAGGQTLLGPYKAPTSTSTSGNLTIAFSDATHATMTRPDGTTVSLERFSFSSTSLAPPVGGAPQNGWWWGGASVSGTGYGIEIQGSSVFIVSYVYDNSGNPLWYLATGALTSANSYSGTWDIYGGGPQLTSPEGAYNAQKVAGTTVGMTLTFTDATHGTLTMGSVTIPIERFQSY